MRNHFKGATPEMLAKALFSKKARRAKPEPKLRRKPHASSHASGLPQPAGAVRSAIQFPLSVANRIRCVCGWREMSIPDPRPVSHRQGGTAG